MRIGVCALLLAGLVAGGVRGSPGVSISAKLQGTVVGRTVVRRLEVYAGKRVEFVVRQRGPDRSNDRYYEGRIDQVIVPDIADFLSTGRGSNAARFKAKVSEVQPKNPQDATQPLPEIVKFRNFSPIGGGNVGHMQYLESPLLGEKFPLARLLAEYRSTAGDSFWEALVEIESEGRFIMDRREVAEPFIVLLSEKEDFLKVVAY